MSKTAMWCFNTEDGDPWAVFYYGHRDPATISLEDVNEALDHGGHEPIENMRVEQLWMFEDEEGGDHPWNICAGDVPGAVAITGVYFQ